MVNLKKGYLTTPMTSLSILIIKANSDQFPTTTRPTTSTSRVVKQMLVPSGGSSKSIGGVSQWQPSTIPSAGRPHHCCCFCPHLSYTCRSGTTCPACRPPPAVPDTPITAGRPWSNDGLWRPPVSHAIAGGIQRRQSLHLGPPDEWVPIDTP